MFCVDLLSYSFWNFFTSDAPLHGVLILEREPTLVTRYNFAKFVRLYPLSQGQQLLTFLNPCDPEILRQLVGDLSQME
jgi:hypothetical protein